MSATDTSPDRRRRRAIVAAAILAGAATGPAITAGADTTAARTRPTAWYWNNEDDRDVRGRFRHDGDTFKMCSFTDNDIYIDYDEYINGENIKRWEVESDLGNGECRTHTDNMTEGIWMAFKVCEQRFWAPDDCSDWVRIKVK